MFCLACPGRFTDFPPRQCGFGPDRRRRYAGPGGARACQEAGRQARPEKTWKRPRVPFPRVRAPFCLERQNEYPQVIRFHGSNFREATRKGTRDGRVFFFFYRGLLGASHVGLRECTPRIRKWRNLMVAIGVLTCKWAAMTVVLRS